MPTILFLEIFFKNASLRFFWDKEHRRTSWASKSFNFKNNILFLIDTNSEPPKKSKKIEPHFSLKLWTSEPQLCFSGSEKRVYEYLEISLLLSTSKDQYNVVTSCANMDAHARTHTIFYAQCWCIWSVIKRPIKSLKSCIILNVHLLYMHNFLY